eukprot:COSAG02_NODE_26192_length_638_cov_1.565863_1_plen_23_part_10
MSAEDGGIWAGAEGRISQDQPDL